MFCQWPTLFLNKKTFSPPLYCNILILKSDYHNDSFYILLHTFAALCIMDPKQPLILKQGPMVIETKIQFVTLAVQPIFDEQYQFHSPHTPSPHQQD